MKNVGSAGTVTDPGFAGRREVCMKKGWNPPDIDGRSYEEGVSPPHFMMGGVLTLPRKCFEFFTLKSRILSHTLIVYVCNISYNL